ncbi:MAG TPA: cytochrome b N-terminal domain-containing protein [Candidatus Dormibacteraeota bacterium]|nr:cytochrome b N-terminal domain-containing protein [Candidatus Dormibacteraeota bacterium]
MTTSQGTSGPAKGQGWLAKVSDQFGFRQMVSDYLIPVETNSIWYLLGGVLAIALGLEVLTGFLIALVYVPDAGRAYDIVAGLLAQPVWGPILNFHFYNSYLIFGLVMLHMVRVFITGGYRRGKEGLWLVGVGLAGLTFIISLTGEALHWDEVGFGVPWNIAEVLGALGLAGTFNYTSDALLLIPTATEKLSQIFVLHVSLIPIALAIFIGWHYLLIRFKGISAPFWLRASGRTAVFTEHIRGWILLSIVILGVVLVISIAFPRDPGVAPQLIPSSPLFGTASDPGGLGFKPTYPISWTRGMNIIAANLGIDPDIWGTLIAMTVLLVALLVIPFVDRGPKEPDSTAAALNWRKRGWAFLAMGVFWFVMIVGVIQNALAEAG